MCGLNDDTRRSRRLRAGWVTLVVGLCLGAGSAGCQEPTTGPIRVGVTQYEMNPPPIFPIVPFKHSSLELGLNQHLGRTVLFQALKPYQIGVHLRSGRLQFAMVPASAYSELADNPDCKVIAAFLDDEGKATRRGLIIVSKDSPIQTLLDVKGKRFHFLPAGDPLNDAALGALLDAGLTKEDIDKGILGLEIDTHHLNSAEVARSLLIEGDAAGVVRESDYEGWEDTGGALRLALPAPSKDQVRVLAKTVAVPEGVVLASTHTSPELVAKMKEYLFSVTEKQKQALLPMGYSGFGEPTGRSVYEPYFAMYRKLHPPAPQEADQGSEDDGEVIELEE